MSQQKLVRAMQEETTARIAGIDHAAGREIQQFEAEVEARLAATRATERQTVRRKLLEYRHWQTSQFENRWRLREQNLCFEMAEAVFQDLEEQLCQLRTRSDYGENWRGLLLLALQTYRAERPDKPILRAAPADRELAESISGECLAVELDDQLADGGVELVSPDRKLRVVNTPSSRLEKGRECFLKTISDGIREKMKR